MSSEKSFIGTVEQNVNDLSKVRKRKPWLFYLLVAGFIAFAALYIFEKFWGIPKLKEQLGNHEKEIQELKWDRDAKANQLAAFQANQTHPKRLISEDRVQMLRGLLATKGITKSQVKITYLGSDRDAYGFATQLADLFRTSEWPVSHVEGALSFSAGALPPLVVESENALPPEVREAFTWIFASFNSPPSLRQTTNTPKGEIHIFVGPR